MSVIVKGMDMPKNCAYCPLSEYRNTSLGQILDCKRIGTVGSAVRGTHDVLNHRHPNCPLVDSPESHWIPVTERLPEGIGRVIAQMDGGAIHDVFYKGKNPYGHVVWVRLDDCIYWDNEVVAWMPLPEPYKGVTDGND